MSYSQWKIPYEGTVVPQALLKCGFTPLLAAVLNKRGLSDPGEAMRFVNCGSELLEDPLMMTDMPVAVRRLSKALASGERIAVYGDYDVDGITSTCLLYDYLKSKGALCDIYIPDRLCEGYGVNCGAIDTLHSRGVTLIVTVDCGVTAVEETSYAASLGIDVIITDHHECQDTLPDAIAVVDPKRPDCNYPTTDLAGVGVAFKLLCAMEGSSKSVLDKYSDLVAVGTIADVMPLTGENRYIIREGLEKLRTSPRPGLAALIDESGLNSKRISASNIGYTLAPRINASGRLGCCDMAVKLLMTQSRQEASHLASELCQLNRERQALETGIWEQAVDMLKKEQPKGPIVLAHEGWHQGVIGIAASRLTEAYCMPAVMICLDGDNGKGSCRSYGGFNLYDALSACSEYLDGFGGHALAAGLTIRRDKVDDFRRCMEQYYREHPPTQESVLNIDICVENERLLDMRCVEDLEKLEPCGNGNPSALLCMCRAMLSCITPIGGGKHLRLRLEKFGCSWDAVYFSHTAEELNLHEGQWVDAAFMPQINDFRSRRSVQLLITDIRAHDFSPAAAVLRGAPADPHALPVRDDFVQLWKKLRTCGGQLSAPLPELCDTLSPGMWDERLCLCLKVFEELGLISIDVSCDNIKIRIMPSAGKVNLADSLILKSTERRPADNESI